MSVFVIRRRPRAIAKTIKAAAEGKDVKRVDGGEGLKETRD